MYIREKLLRMRPKRPSRRLLAGLALALVVFAHTAPAQSQKEKEQQKKQDDTIRLETRLVTMDVIVKDKKGKYITDLKAGDFTVYENGVAQKLDFFEAPIGGGGETSQPETPVPGTPGAAGGSGRSNLVSIVMDGATTDLANFKQVRDGAIRYIRERITDHDTVAVFGIANDLQLLQSFTQDKARLIAALEKGATMPASNKNLERSQAAQTIEQMRAEINNLGGVNPSASPASAAGGAAAAAMGSAAGQAQIANRILQQFTLLRSQLSIQQARPVLAALAAICSAQQGIPGKKTVILFSQGFVTSSTLDWQVQSVIDIANRANISVYILDSAGLRTSTPLSTSPVPNAPLTDVSGLASKESRIQAVGGENVFDNVRHEGLNREYDILYRISGDTGGEFIKGSNDLAKGLGRIDDEIRARYTLAWYSSDGNFDGGFRKLKVDVRRPDARVSSRAGYYANAGEELISFSPEEKKLLAGVAAAEANPALPLFVELSPFRFRGGNYIVPMSIEVPPSSMKFESKADKQVVQFDVLGLIREKPGKIISRLGGGFNIGLTKEQYQMVQQNNIFVRQDIELAPGNYEIEMLFRDRLSGKVAAKRENLVLPVLESEFSTSGLVLSRHVEPIRQVAGAPPAPPDILSQAGVQIRPSPSHEFRAGDNMVILFEVYNAEVNKETGTPMVWVSVRLMKDDQPATKPVDYVLTESTALPVPHLTFARFIKLSGLAAGRYTAIIETRDMITKKLIKIQSPFVITQ